MTYTCHAHNRPIITVYADTPLGAARLYRDYYHVIDNVIVDGKTFTFLQIVKDDPGDEPDYDTLGQLLAERENEIREDQIESQWLERVRE